MRVSSKPIKKRVYEAFLGVHLIQIVILFDFNLSYFPLGVVPPLITVSIIKSISFSVYEKTKAYYKRVYPNIFDQNTMFSTMAISTFAGSVSGAFIATLSCPFELIKVQKQLEFLLQTSSISTGATVYMRDLKPTMNRTVGAGLPVAPIATPPVARDKPALTVVTPKKRNMYTSTSSWHSAKDIFRKKGLTGLYSGFSLHLGKTFFYFDECS